MHNVASPDTSDPGVERRILTLGKTAPRVTPQDIEANVIEEYYFTAEQGAWTGNAPRPHKALATLTFCVLVLKNGFTVTGESAPASPDNFDPSIGQDIARQNAVNKIWPLMGYELKTRLHHERNQEIPA